MLPHPTLLTSIYSKLHFILESAFLFTNAWGDIFAYVDSNGVLNFTDFSADSRYRLFLETGKKGKYSREIRHAASANHVDPALIKAVIRTESNFDPHAISRKGARGLMQITPDTAKDYGVNDAFDPDQNIEAGAKHLHRLLLKFKDNISLALAAYNAGENTVLKYGKIPPYNETMDYVSRVIGFYRRFKESDGY